jgi:hypothetical protein
MSSSATKSTFFQKKRACLLLSLFFLPWSALHAAQQIKVPLGCSWGDDLEKLNQLIRTGGLTLLHTETVPLNQKKVVTVTGVIGTALQKNLFTFQQEQLIEIEYRYGDKKWDAKKYGEFFDNFREMFERKYGPAMLLINTTIPPASPHHISSSIIGYRWAQSPSVLDLYYYSAEQKNRHYYLVSVHYKTP